MPDRKALISHLNTVNTTVEEEEEEEEENIHINFLMIGLYFNNLS
jgi:hypothetical protein